MAAARTITAATTLLSTGTGCNNHPLVEEDGRNRWRGALFVNGEVFFFYPSRGGEKKTEIVLKSMIFFSGRMDVVFFIPPLM